MDRADWASRSTRRNKADGGKSQELSTTNVHALLCTCVRQSTMSARGRSSPSTNLIEAVAT